MAILRGAPGGRAQLEPADEELSFELLASDELEPESDEPELEPESDEPELEPESDEPELELELDEPELELERLSFL